MFPHEKSCVHETFLRLVSFTAIVLNSPDSTWTVSGLKQMTPSPSMLIFHWIPQFSQTEKLQASQSAR